MQKSKIVIFLFFVFFIFVPKQVFSQKSYVVEALQGMDTLKVKVVIQPDMEQAGLRAKRIQTVVEIKLRQAGIKVKSEDERNSPQENFLYIKVDSLKNDEDFFATNIATVMRQNVILERKKSVTILGTVWETSNIGVVSITKAGMLIEQISEQVDEFINDWLKVNASTSKKEQDDELNKILELYKTPLPPVALKAKQNDSPFTSVYVGGNGPPKVEILNDSDRTLYLDLGQGVMTPYTIPSKTTRKLTLNEGDYGFKATATRVHPLEGRKLFEKGHIYYWKFVVITTGSTIPGVNTRRRRRRP
jgi:hypothetical protein